MFSRIPVRRLVAVSCVATFLTACAEAPTSPSSSPLAPVVTPDARINNTVVSGGAPAPQPAGPLSGTWFGTLTFPAPGSTPYRASLTIVQSGTGISGTFTQSSATLERPVTLDAAGSVGGGRVSLTLRAQKGRPKQPSPTYTGTLSADSTTMTLTTSGGTEIVLSHF